MTERQFDHEGVEIIDQAREVLGAVLRASSTGPNGAVLLPDGPERAAASAVSSPRHGSGAGRAKVRPYVLVDSREKLCLRFPPELGVDCGVATLPAGDYSVRGFTHLIALERKSLADLVSTLSHGRERFENELDLLAAYRWSAIIIEADQADVEAHIYRSNMLPKSVLGSLRAFWWRWKVPHFWATDARGAAEHVAWCARRLHEKHPELMENTKEETE